MNFQSLQLNPQLLRAIEAEGYTTPTPIQQQAIPVAMQGRDVLGCAQTGTGKTAAFALPVLHQLAAAGPSQKIRCLVLTPTRELATQIGDSFATYGRHLGLRHSVVFGGVGQEPQVRAIKRGVDVLIATPGRLLDLINQRVVSFAGLEIFVLDEADRMLDMGFIHDVRKILNVIPKQRQTLFFSATMPGDIQRLADNILKDPVRVAVTPVATTAETIDQRVYFVDKGHKRNLLVHVLNDPAIARAIVFTRTKNGANRVAKHLVGARIGADAIHGNKSQSARERALGSFRDGSLRVLVATDIAARGIDVDGVTHVINFELPNVPENYVHRIGRTGRAGAAGIALSFCDSEERAFLRDIERTTRKAVAIVTDHPYPMGSPGAVAAEERGGREGGGRGGNQQRRGGQSSRGGSRGSFGGGQRSSAPRGGGESPRAEQRASTEAPRGGDRRDQPRDGNVPSDFRAARQDGRGGPSGGGRPDARGRSGRPEQRRDARPARREAGPGRADDSRGGPPPSAAAKVPAKRHMPKWS